MHQNKDLTIFSIGTVVFIIFIAVCAYVLFGFLVHRPPVQTNTFSRIIYAICMNILGILFVYATVLLIVLALGIALLIVAFAATPGDGLGIFLMAFAWTLSWYPLLSHVRLAPNP